MRGAECVLTSAWCRGRGPLTGLCRMPLDAGLWIDAGLDVGADETWYTLQMTTYDLLRCFWN